MKYILIKYLARIVLLCPQVRKLIILRLFSLKTFKSNVNFHINHISLRRRNQFLSKLTQNFKYKDYKEIQRL